MAGNVLQDVTRPYSFLESLIYDRVIAPAVLRMAAQAEDAFVHRIAPGARLLDVGCGGGHLLAHFAKQRSDIRLTGIDLSPDQVKRARRRLSPDQARTDVHQGSALELPFPDAQFDAVYSMASIKHWPDHLQGLRECTRVLRPGGLLLVIEADRGCRMEDVRRFTRDWHVPRLLSVVPEVVFRTYVSGHSIDLEDARELLAGLPLTKTDAYRVAGTPALALEGIRT